MQISDLGVSKIKKWESEDSHPCEYFIRNIFVNTLISWFQDWLNGWGRMSHNGKVKNIEGLTQPLGPNHIESDYTQYAMSMCKSTDKISLIYSCMFA